jgi:predicted transcriptional regulator
MSDSVMLSVRLPADLAGRLEALAGKKDRTKSYLVARALEDYIAAEEEFFAVIAQGESDADAGRLVDHEEVSRWLRDIACGKRRPPPQSRRDSRK